jgi:hypothetical protein
MTMVGGHDDDCGGQGGTSMRAGTKCTVLLKCWLVLLLACASAGAFER